MKKQAERHFLLYLVVLSVTSFSTQTLLSSANDQCTLLIDSLTNEEFDYIYRDGSVVSLEPASRISLDCLPEIKNITSETSCVWMENGEKFYHHHVHTFRGGLCWLSAEISALSLVSLVNSGYTNFTCLSTNSRTGREASMTYIVHYLPTLAVSGYNPSLYSKRKVYRASVGDTMNVTCEAYLESPTSALFQLNWYLVNQKKERQSVTELYNHNLTACSHKRDEKTIELNMIIYNISEDMFGRQYECVISKVDVRSAFNRTISSHRYQFRSIDLPNNGTLQHVQLKPEVSTVENLSFYDNSLPNVCTRVSPCAVTFRFNLLGPNEEIQYLEMHVALGIVGGTAIIAAVLLVYIYIRGIFLRNQLKHFWGITSDCENMQDFQYHAVVFYSENNEEEELFVQGDLLPRLENRWKYKICIPQRDFLIGANKAEQCIDGVNCSQKVIFVLTTAMLSQEWNIYSLDVALKEHRKIIILKRDNIDFQALLETHGKNFGDVESALKVSKVVEWQRDKHKWQRLHVQMPAVITNSIRHRSTSCVRKLLKHFR